MSSDTHANQAASDATQPPLPPRFEAVIYQCLKQGDTVKEYDLMKYLVDEGFSQFTPSLEPLALFRGHFLLFHLLYRLQDKWQQQNKGQLCIHTLEICLKPNQRALEQTTFALTESDEVKRYYLDYNTFLSTQEQDVIDLIDQFWQSFGHQPVSPRSDSKTEIDQAKQCLQITSDLTTETGSKVVMKQFRALSQIHHPDKGGEAEAFHAICHAKEVLLERLQIAPIIHE